jgi:hypothetical protein
MYWFVAVILKVITVIMYEADDPKKISTKKPVIIFIFQKSLYLCGVRGIRPAPSELPQGRNTARVGS